MKLLDLFCCCGGISKGFSNNGWECTGVDITDNHQYPYKFIHKDVFDLPLSFFEQFDLIHASPPCQLYAWGVGKKYRHNHPDLVDRTRQLLLQTSKPFIIENVQGAPLRKDLILCGEMFGLRVIRHRIFEIEGFTVLQPKHLPHKQPIQIENSRGLRKKSYYACVVGGGAGDTGFTRNYKEWLNAMGIDWVTKKEHLTQMIPPAYSEYISKFV